MNKITSENLSYIVRNIEDLSQRKVGDRISIGEDGRTGILKFKGPTKIFLWGEDFWVYEKQVPIAIEDSKKQRHLYIFEKDKIKYIPFVA